MSDRITRRTFLELAGLGMASVAASSLLTGCGHDMTPDAQPTQAPPVPPVPVDLHLRLRAVPGEVNILPGGATRAWQYRGEVLSGEPAALQSLPNSYLGPILRVARGTRVRVDLHNDLSQETIIHWHGLHVPEEADGHPRYAIGPGQAYTYYFTVRDRAGTYWFHPHPHGLTGPQVYYGLAGLFLVSDDEEEALNLPSGDYDVPLVLQDRLFDRSNQLRYVPNGMADRMLGMLGDRILVNGWPDYRLHVARRSYRFRLLNGSNSRVYKLAWEDGAPLTVIGTDGGLLERPVSRPYVTLAPAERAELWVDFHQWPLGTTQRLVSLPFAGATVGTMGLSSSSPLDQGDGFPVMAVDVVRDEPDPSALPARLSTIPRLTETDSVNQNNPRRWALSMRGMTWTINGKTFVMDQADRDEIVRLGTQETWVFDNTQSGAMGMMGGMRMIHPMHVHGLQFQIVERQVERGFEAAWRTVSEGLVDEGWKDSFLLMPGERAKVLMRFEDYTGLYLVHCHNLEHEDLGMMRNYRVDH